MTSDTAAMELLTPAEVAEALQITPDQVKRLRRRHNWPCVQLSPKQIRFTREHVAQIVAFHTATPTPTDERAPEIPGQTPGSRRRRPT